MKGMSLRVAVLAALTAALPGLADDSSSDRAQGNFQGNFQVPGWIISQPDVIQRPAEIINPNSSFGSPSFAGTTFGAPFGGGWLGGPAYGYGGYGWNSPARVFGPGIGYGAGLPGFGYGGWRGSYLGGGGWGMPGFGAVPFAGGSGFGGPVGFGGPLGFGGWGGGLGGWRGGYGGYGGWRGGWGGGWGWGNPGTNALMMGAFGNSFRSGNIGRLTSGHVTQTGPSPSSGNYYAPSSIDPSASGSYYAQKGTAVIPMQSPSSQPKDYWGSTGNPFGNAVNNSTPWNK